MGVSASKTQNDEPQLVTRGQTGGGSPHQRRSRRQHHSTSSPPAPGIPSQAQFGYLIQQIGEDPNQVQVTPGYYYAGYEQSKRRRQSHRRHNSAPASSQHRSHYRSADSKTTTSQPQQQQHQHQHRSSRERRHTSRRSTEPPRETRSRVKESRDAPDLEVISEGENITAGNNRPTPSGEAVRPTKRPEVSAKKSTSSHPDRRQHTVSDPVPNDAVSAKNRRENPLPRPPKPAYENDKYQHLRRSQTVEATPTAGPSRREPIPERSNSERRPKPHQPRPNDLTHRKTASVDVDNRIEKKLPRPPIKDRVLEKLFKDGDSRGDPSPSRKGPLSALRSLTFPNIPIKKTFLNRSESRLPIPNRRATGIIAGDQPPPYAGPPVSIPLSSPLNPASPHEVTFKKKIYPTAAHLFEAHKFMKHKPELAERLRMVNESPYEMGKLAYSFQMGGLVREDWELVWRDKLDEVLWLKFAQHPRLREELLSTGYSLLLDGNEVRHADPDTPGVNELGKAYMRLRDRLRKGEQ